ncbi:MAG: hypothetical protein IAE94_16465 [Chthoniobacterales bacterium]|nr:hypothetical protein [Chthoniobacterales bacterium]
MNPAAAEHGIFADHPGGNIVVERREGSCLWLAPDLRHMQAGCQWFYWSFRAHNENPLTVVFSHRNYISAHGPAMSRDGGATWKWLGRENVRQREIGEHGVELAFDLPPVRPGEDVRYAFCPQYQESHLRSWLRRHEDHPFLSVSEFCRSRGGRSVEQIRIGDACGTRKILWLTARHHSCEAMAGYALEGMLEAALADDATGRRLRENFTMVAMPFMDKDGVEEGDQGKLRHPHDHNRDYNATPLFPEVAAAMRYGRENKDAITAFLDLHCPMVHGPWDNRFYLVGSPLPAVAARQDAFMKAFAESRTGAIAPHEGGILHFGEAWNTADNFSAGKSATLWAEETFPDAGVIASFEVPYANADGMKVTPESARSLGRDLAVALLACPSP